MFCQGIALVCFHLENSEDCFGSLGVLGGEFVSEHLSLAEKPRAPLIPGLRIQRMFSWALPSGELGRLPGEFCQFTNSIRKELSATSISG
jgi:hypothetical protein